MQELRAPREPGSPPSRVVRAMRRHASTAALALLPLVVAACERDEAWDEDFVRGDTVGLNGSVAVVDRNRDELVMLTSRRKNELGSKRIPIGRNIVTAVPSRDRETLLVLSRGVTPRLRADDQRPRLSVIAGGVEPELLKQYELDDPLQKLALDPLGEWAVAHSAEGAVVNPNELILVHLAEPDEAPIPITIRSSGGSPQRFTFTSSLSIPGGAAHRLLVIETDRDLSILDLENPLAQSLYVPLPATQSATFARPAQVVFHDDVPGGEVASYLAVRVENDSDVLTLRLTAPTRTTAAFSVVNNIVDAGARPSTIDFVETDSGLRLAALVPDRRQAVLFDPATSKSELVEFDQPYSGIARVTNLVDDRPEKGDVALLYSKTAQSIAFWRLAEASSTPYASFDAYPVENQVNEVLDVPGEQYAHLKLLVGQSSSDFFLLDLQSRLSHPMHALDGFSLRLSPDGERAWAFAPSSLQVAELGFEDKHPVTVSVQRPLADVFDIQRADGGRTLVALHAADAGSLVPYGSDFGVTLFDAEAPDSADTRFYSGLMLEGL